MNWSKIKICMFVANAALGIGCSDVGFNPTEENIRKRFANNSIVIDGNKKYTSKADVKLSIEGEDQQEMYVTNDPKCNDGGQWEQFNPDKDWTLIELNAFAEVYVKFRDESGFESPCIFDDIIHDNTPPVASFKSTPSKLNNSATANFELTAQDNISGVKDYFCWNKKIRSYVLCDQNEIIRGLKEGENKFKFVATDNAGNLSASALFQWTIDLTPPRVLFTRTPRALEPVDTAKFAFFAKDNMSQTFTYSCSLDNGQSVKCDSSHDLSGLDSRQHQVSVVATDEAGNSSLPTTHTWVVDTIAPSVNIVSAPVAATNSPIGKFKFQGLDQGTSISSFECQIDGGPITSCKSKSSWTFTEGSHTLHVRSVDRAGHRSKAAQHTWTVDLTPPVVRITAAPEPIEKKLSTRFKFAGTDIGTGIDHYLCEVDSSVDKCNSPLSYSVFIGGKHKFKVWAVDKAGNKSIAQTHRWQIDTGPPVVNITRGPDNWVNQTSAQIEFKSSDRDTSVVKSECRLDKNNYSGCTSPHKVSGLKEGRHTLSVRVEDLAGNISQPDSHEWGVDLTPPTIHWVQKPKHDNAFTNLELKIQAKDKLSGLGSVACTLNGKNVPCLNNSKFSIFIDTEGPQTFTVTAKDQASNVITSTINWEATSPFKKIEQDLVIDRSRLDIDILFVIDNSGSMQAEQRSMSKRIDHFVGMLTNLNWRASVTSTDPNGDKPNGDGQIVPFPNGNYYLDNSLDPKDAQAYLGNTVQMGKQGSDDEKGINSTYRFLERQIAMDKNHPSYVLRNHAQLAVVLISDEDENGYDYRNRPNNLINFVKKTWSGQKSFMFHSIIVGDEDCLEEDYGHAIGYEYELLSRRTGGIVGSICEDDYSEQLKNIGNGVREQLSSFNLSCQPQDIDGNGRIEMDIALEGGGQSPHYHLKNNKIIFDEPLPAGQHKLTYYCLRPGKN